MKKYLVLNFGNDFYILNKKLKWVNPFCGDDELDAESLNTMLNDKKYIWSKLDLEVLSKEQNKRIITGLTGKLAVIEQTKLAHCSDVAEKLTPLINNLIGK